jgi:hypothetical protein
MYQQFINGDRTNQYQQECRREAATERALRAGGQPVGKGPGRVPLPWPPIRLRPALAWFIIAAHRALAAGSTAAK